MLRETDIEIATPWSAAQAFATALLEREALSASELCTVIIAARWSFSKPGAKDYKLWDGFLYEMRTAKPTAG